MTRREMLERDGYVVVQNVLSATEIGRLRETLLGHFSQRWVPEYLGKHQPSAAIEIPGISWIFKHPPLLAIFRELFGTPQIVFTGNCDAHMNMLGDWHKDVCDFRLCRTGIYLQDHTSDGRGLKVRLTSHRSPSLMSGEITSVPTRAGDIVFFDPRLTHAGQFPDFLEYALYRITRRLRRPQLGLEIKELYWQVMRKAPKLSVFFTFGIADAETEQFCLVESRARAERDPNARFLAPELIDALANAGVVSYGIHGFFPTSIESEVPPRCP